MRCTFRTCRSVLREDVDRLGRVAWVCGGCERRRAGVCALCPHPVTGTVGKAKYCAFHRKWVRLTMNDRWLDNNRDRRNATARVRKRINPREAMSPRASGRLGGMVGGKRRAEHLSPERRSEIARIAAQARWGTRAAVA